MTMTTTATTETKPGAAPAAGSPRGRRRVDPTYWTMLLPAVALYTGFITVPAVAGMLFSLTDYVGFGDWEFIGLRNYSALFSDPRILGAYGFTLSFAVVTTVVVNVVALALALGLS